MTSTIQVLPGRLPVKRIAWPFGSRTVRASLRAHTTPEPDIQPPMSPPTLPPGGPDEAPVPVQDPSPLEPDPIIDTPVPPIVAR